jgi:hypothetical protein
MHDPGLHEFIAYVPGLPARDDREAAQHVVSWLHGVGRCMPTGAAIAELSLCTASKQGVNEHQPNLTCS